MVDVHFYFNAPDRLLSACHLAAGRYASGERLAVYCRDRSRLHSFNRLLWEYARGAFVPHVLAADPMAAHTPIVLFGTTPPPAFRTILNLDLHGVPEADQYDVILEIVGTDAAEREPARLRWRSYQQAGHTIHRHDIAGQDLPLPS